MLDELVKYWAFRSRTYRDIQPMSPAADDVQWYEASIQARMTQVDRPLRGLLLGVTPAIVAMRWPEGVTLVAVDGTKQMIENVWRPPSRNIVSVAINARWQELPFEAGTFDVVLGDGCQASLANFATIADVNREIARVLRPGGLFLARCFCRAEAEVAPEAVIEAYQSGDIADPHLFRFLLAMALHGRTSRGISLRSVADFVRERFSAGASATLRDHATVDGALETWTTFDPTFIFPTPDEFAGLTSPWFEVTDRSIPPYPNGAQFPRFALQTAMADVVPGRGKGAHHGEGPHRAATTALRPPAR